MLTDSLRHHYNGPFIATLLNSTSSWVELRRYKRAFKLSLLSHMCSERDAASAVAAGSNSASSTAVTSQRNNRRQSSLLHRLMVSIILCLAARSVPPTKEKVNFLPVFIVCLSVCLSVC